MIEISNAQFKEIVKLLDCGRWDCNGTDKERNDARKARILVKKLKTKV